MWNRVTSFEGAGVVDEGWLGNDERGLPVEWYGSLKNLSKNIFRKGVDTEAKIVATGGVSDFLLPPFPPQKKIVHHGTYRDRRSSTKRGLILIGLELNTNARESFERC